jgi:hypothetical protein
MTVQRPTIQLPSRELCTNTDVYFTPGFGMDDLSVVVRNVRDFGTIAIVGEHMSVLEASAMFDMHL